MDTQFKTQRSIDTKKGVKANLYIPSDEYCIMFGEEINLVDLKSSFSEQKAVKVSEFNAKVPKDLLYCHLSDVLILGDFRILVADFWNSKIKLFGGDTRHLTSLDLTGHPWNMAKITESNIAVTVPKEKRILTVKVKNGFQIDGEIKTKFECWGIAALNEHLLAITTARDGHYVIIMTTDGLFIHQIRPPDFRANGLLRPIHVATDESRTALYVTYSEGNKLVTFSVPEKEAQFSFDKDILFIYEDKGLRKPLSVDVDEEGNQYLCCYLGGCVQQISYEGLFIKRLISKKKQKMYPLSIKFHHKSRKLMVTYGWRDVIEIYEMKE
ncbi:hypothetical protein CHS0354_021007 [Potamilus streckersoni]|uniref:Uncharacterized protein n=1 Tax=Potamilus streckersoni TaxID=2493646 RepID=A0AAE0RUL0_9BIVA|nr:hypothetical protein CHS0354_021007 [Potamilus streckersoni]